MLCRWEGHWRRDGPFWSRLRLAQVRCWLLSTDHCWESVLAKALRAERNDLFGRAFPLVNQRVHASVKIALGIKSAVPDNYASDPKALAQHRFAPKGPERRPRSHWGLPLAELPILGALTNLLKIVLGGDFMRAILIAAAVVAFHTPVSAQLPAETCVSLANIVASGMITNFGHAQFESMRHYANCEASQRASSSALNITYAAFGLGAKYDDNQKKSQCTQDTNKLGYNYTTYHESKVVFDRGLATVDLCIEKASRNWSIVSRQVSPDSISFNIANMHPSGGDLVGIDMIPDNGMTCIGAPAQADFPKKLTSTAYVSMTCTRPVQKNTIDSVTVSSTQDVTLNLRLADGPFPIYLKGYTTSPFDAIRKEINSLRNDVNNIRKSIYEGSEASASGWDCPAGSYAFGANTVGIPGGAHGYTAASTLKCKPLKFPPPPTQ